MLETNIKPRTQDASIISWSFNCQAKCLAHNGFWKKDKRFNIRDGETEEKREFPNMSVEMK